MTMPLYPVSIRSDPVGIEFYFRWAPKLVRFFPGASASLSSASFFFPLLLLPVPVGVPVPLSRKDPDTGVGAWDAGVDPGVPS